MRITIVGPGRAGGAIALAAASAGHEIAGIVARRSDVSLAERLAAPLSLIGDPLPPSDLLVIAVRDDAITEVAAALATGVDTNVPAVHLSGLAPVSALAPLSDVGVDVGSFHPLQTLPDPDAGAAALDGAHIAATGGADLVSVLESLARSLGAEPFYVADRIKAVYHAAAAAGANYVIAALAMAESLFEAADVDMAVARPLVEAVVANTFERGALPSLTGPIARGDVSTVERQLAAVAEHAPHLVEHFKAMGRATAELGGTTELMDEVLR